MYKLNFDGQPVYDPRGTNETDRLIIVDPSVTLAVNAAGSVSFSIYPNHPLAGKITCMRGTLELEDDDGTIFRGRILKDEATFYGAKKYTAEGALAYLNDSIVDPYIFPDDFTGQPGYQAAADPSGNMVAWWLAWLLDKHNAQAPADRQIRLGTVTVKDPNNYITRENSKYSSTWETISEKLVGSALGGYLIVRYEDDGNYLDYLAELPRTNPQRVQFAENLLDIIIKGTGENLFTAILPVGADGLTLAGLPDGPLEGGMQKAGKIIFDPAAEAEYGSRITRVRTWDDVTLAENLQTKAAAELSAGVRLPESISVRACDLHGVDGMTPHFRVGQYVRVESTPHGISAAYPLLEMTPNILDPGSTTINLNTTAAKFTSQLRAAQVAAEQGTQSAIREASKRFNDIIQQASGLYCTPEPQPDESVIYYLHDKKTLAESTLVMKLTAEAIGFSTDGGATYPYGFTLNGEMVMAIIKANGIETEWLKAGTIDLSRLRLEGDLGGIAQGQGRDESGPTNGIVLFGPSGLSPDGVAIPPYVIMTNKGFRVQVSEEVCFYISGSTLVINAGARVDGDATISGQLLVDSDLFVSGEIQTDENLWIGKNLSNMSPHVSVFDSETSGYNLVGYSRISGAVWVSSSGQGLVLHGDSITADREVVVTSDRDKKKDIEPLVTQVAPVAASDAPQEAPSIDGIPASHADLAAKYAALMDALEPVRFRYINDRDDAPRHIGYIYQDAMAALEAAGLTPEDMAAFSAGVDETGAPFLGIAYAELVPLLHMEIKSLKAQINQLLEGK